MLFPCGSCSVWLGCFEEDTGHLESMDLVCPCTFTLTPEELSRFFSGWGRELGAALQKQSSAGCRLILSSSETG